VSFKKKSVFKKILKNNLKIKKLPQSADDSIIARGWGPHGVEILNRHCFQTIFFKDTFFKRTFL